MMIMMRLELLLLVSALTGCIQAQSKTVFDLSRLFGARNNEPLTKLLDRNLPEVQQLIDRTKETCLEKLDMPPSQRSLMRVTSPSEQEKLLIECVLKGIKIMDSSSNRLNLHRVQELTSMVTDDNKLAMAVSSSMAQNCNRSILTKSSSEAAHQLNQCISRQLERNMIQLSW
ncbi:GH17591 [Drosophila grimshawi]|uniref:GH17591 n=2 Tax=Drosophila grimshawi TaxID=7222 RepID=B4JXD3_DROGR|nr:GH17591 [Drosophila grimshawi]